MKQLCCLLWFLLFSACANAELSYEILAKLTDSPASLTGKFNQDKTLKQFGVNIISEGHFDYKRNEFIRWFTEKPISNQLIMTPQDITSRQGNDEMLRINTDKNPTMKILSKIFFAVLTAEWIELADYFYANGQQNNTDWHVTLTPKDPLLAESINMVELAGDKLLKEVTLYENNGDTTYIQFSHLQTP